MTALQLFETLPEPVRSRAIKNARNEGNLNFQYHDLADAILWALDWNDMPDYWNDFHNGLTLTPCTPNTPHTHTI